MQPYADTLTCFSWLLYVTTEQTQHSLEPNGWIYWLVDWCQKIGIM